jgi:hypothetical protein
VKPSQKTKKRKPTKSGKVSGRPPRGKRENLNELKATDLTAFNTTAEERFHQLVCKLIREEGPVTVRVVQSEAAYELNISLETAKRYLGKHTARRAHFSFTADGRVTCRHAV